MEVTTLLYGRKAIDVQWFITWRGVKKQKTKRGKEIQTKNGTPSVRY